MPNDAPTKPWWQSKTLIANAIASLVVIGANAGLDFLPSIAPDLQVLGLALLNIAIRVFTKKPLSVS